MGTCLYAYLRSYVLATSVLSRPATSHFRKKLTQNCRKSINHMQVHLVVGCSVIIDTRHGNIVNHPLSSDPAPKERAWTPHILQAPRQRGLWPSQALLLLLFLPRAAGPLHCHQKICRRPKWPGCVCPPHAGAGAA